MTVTKKSIDKFKEEAKDVLTGMKGKSLTKKTENDVRLLSAITRLLGAVRPLVPYAEKEKTDGT